MTIFLYIRLSSADKDIKFKSESESISNQRELLHRYIAERPDLAGAVVEEFADDGYSGTNADRPSFERMIERVKNCEADVIICKDFSRFFRDYVEIGDYLEKIFPFLGVRYIRKRQLRQQRLQRHYSGYGGCYEVYHIFLI